MAVINGGPGNDGRNGTSSADQMFGFDGNDVLQGLEGDDEIHGGTGNDQLIGGEGADQLFGDSGDDAIIMGRSDQFGVPGGQFGSDFADGGEGVDTVRVSWFNQLINNVAISIVMDFAGGNFTVQGGGSSWEQGSNFERLHYYGSDGGDIVTGGNLNDFISLGTGADVVNALGGDDQIEDRGGAVNVNGGDGADMLTFASLSNLPSVAIISGGGTTFSFSGSMSGSATSIERIRVLIGTGFSDQFTGGSGDDTFDGANGVDTIAGGGGSDTITGGDGADVLRGDGGNDNISGGFGADDIAGGADNDTVNGGGDNDALKGDAGNDTLTGSEGDDTLNGDAGTDILNGDNGADALSGGEDNDTLRGGGGADALNGGSGADTATYDFASGAVVVDMEIPLSGTGDAVGDTFVDVENLIGTSFADTLRGNDNANTLNGGMGDDVLEGRGGGDQLDGGQNGIDTASYASAAASVTASLIAPASNAGEAAGDTYTSIENLEGSAFNDILTGNAPAALGNIIRGLGGNDILFGYNDGLNGGGFTPGDQLDGGEGDDTLYGSRGADTYIGGAGVDSVRYDDRNNGNLVIDMATPANSTGVAKSDVFGADIEHVVGGLGQDTVRGDGNANSLHGGAGNDALNGGDGDDALFGESGADTLDGGAGVDAASYVGAVAAITARLDLGFGVDEGGFFDTYLSIENVVGTGFNDTLYGVANVANRLEGGAGDDTFVADGVDTIVGGVGLDVLFTGAGAALNLNVGNAGLETVWGGALADVMNGSVATANLTLVGQGASGDTMTGGSGADFVYFRAGDTVSGGVGNDWAVATLSTTGVNLNLTATGFENAWGSTSADTLTSASATISVVLVGDAGNDTLTGGTVGDFLYGLGDDDTLNGGAGNDTLVGGGGADNFAFGPVWGVDTVWDWTNGSEKFNLVGSGATSFAQISIVQNLSNSGNALISFGANQILVVGGANQIDASDFVF